MIFSSLASEDFHGCSGGPCVHDRRKKFLVPRGSRARFGGEFRRAAAQLTHRARVDELTKNP